MGKRPGLDTNLFPAPARSCFETRGSTQCSRTTPDRCSTAERRHGSPASERLVHVEHDVWQFDDPKRLRLMRLAAALTRPHVVGVAERMREPLSRIYPRRPVEIIANGVALDPAAAIAQKLDASSASSGSAPVIGAVGRLERVKGHDLLIEAAAELAPQPFIFIVGDGSRRADLEHLAWSLGIADRVRFLGHRDNVAQILPAFDVLCQPSRAEGLPLAVLEAQACGVPVVATDVGDLASAVCPVSGRLAPPENVAALAAALKAALVAPARGLAAQPSSPPVSTGATRSTPIRNF